MARNYQKIREAVYATAKYITLIYIAAWVVNATRLVKISDYVNLVAFFIVVCAVDFVAILINTLKDKTPLVTKAVRLGFQGSLLAFLLLLLAMQIFRFKCPYAMGVMWVVVGLGVLSINNCNDEEKNN